MIHLGLFLLTRYSHAATLPEKNDSNEELQKTNLASNYDTSLWWRFPVIDMRNAQKKRSTICLIISYRISPDMISEKYAERRVLSTLSTRQLNNWSIKKKVYKTTQIDTSMPLEEWQLTFKEYSVRRRTDHILKVMRNWQIFWGHFT